MCLVEMRPIFLNLFGIYNAMITKTYIQHNSSSLNQQRDIIKTEPRILNTEYNIGFKLPLSDTCKFCDEHQIKLISNKNDEIATVQLNRELELHQRRAKAMQDSLTLELKNAKNNAHDVICFDLQQALPTPNLSVGDAFYLRKKRKKQTTEDNKPLKFKDVRCFKFQKEYPNVMFIKHLFNEEFKKVNIGKRGPPVSSNSGGIYNKLKIYGSTTDQ